MSKRIRETALEVANPEILSCALNETINALRFTESAVSRFAANTDGLERGSRTATSVGYLVNSLSDAYELLVRAEGEIERLMQQNHDETVDSLVGIRVSRMKIKFLPRRRAHMRKPPG